MILNRCKGILLNPATEFNTIKNEELSIPAINKFIVIPFAILIAIATMAESIISNLPSSVMSLIFIFIDGIITYLLILSYAYLSGKVIVLLAKNMENTSNSREIYSLAVYSQIPFLILLTLIKLFPSLVFLIVLGLYSALIFHTGTGLLTRLDFQKRIQFMILSVLIMIISFITLSELYTLLYSEIIDQFSTFAG